MCYDLLFKNRRNKRQVHVLNLELKKKKIAEMRKKIINIENRNRLSQNTNVNGNPKLYIKKKEIKNIKSDNDYLKKLEMEGPIHFLHRPVPNFKQISKNNNKNKIIIPKMTLDMKNSQIYKRRMKKTTSKSKSTLV